MFALINRSVSSGSEADLGKIGCLHAAGCAHEGSDDFLGGIDVNVRNTLARPTPRGRRITKNKEATRIDDRQQKLGSIGRMAARQAYGGHSACVGVEQALKKKSGTIPRGKGLSARALRKDRRVALRSFRPITAALPL